MFAWVWQPCVMPDPNTNLADQGEWVCQALQPDLRYLGLAPFLGPSYLGLVSLRV